MIVSLLIRLAIVLAAATAMEMIAWSSHKYIMHGFGWGWHRDHHERHDRALEKNDLYAVVGAAISISCFMIGSPLVLGAMAWWPAARLAGVISSDTPSSASARRSSRCVVAQRIQFDQACRNCLRNAPRVGTPSMAADAMPCLSSR